MTKAPNFAEPHILVVDDRRDIRDPLRQYLQKQGMRVLLASNAAEARKLLPDAAIDLIVLDIMMPGEDGLSLCRHIRSSSNVPIILLTALSDETDRIVGLELGADDYLVKPFNPRELLARIRAVLRRGQTEQIGPEADMQIWTIGPWKFELSAQVLHHEDGTSVSLSSSESKLLEVMAQRAGRVLSREQLLDLTKGRNAGPFDRAIDNHISRLRKKLKHSSSPERILQTVWGNGYKLIAKVDIP